MILKAESEPTKQENIGALSFREFKNTMIAPAFIRYLNKIPRNVDSDRLN